MNNEVFKQREQERADRLLDFVKLELRSMWLDARLQFAIDLWTYLTPEMKELLRQGKIKEQT